MVTVTREFADSISEVAQLLKADEAPDEALLRLTRTAVELVPGSTAAEVTVAVGDGALSFARSDRRLDKLHRLQFD
jgi:hypothetical protein